MKTLLLLSLLTAYQSSGHLISSDTSFTPDAAVRIEPDPACVKIRATQEDFRTSEEKRKLNNCVQSKVETGSLNGVTYQIHYTDGSGSFAGQSGLPPNDFGQWGTRWRVSCRKDAMTDRGSCFMYLRDLWVFVNADGKATLSIGSEHYPGSDVMLRVDKRVPVIMNTRLLKGSFNLLDSQKLIAELSRAKTITTRYRKWPNNHDRDDMWEEIVGFNEALQYLKWAVARIK
ncbi:MAG: hypothetical protein AABN95_16140 [Acidobacteriota bacterium]